MEEMKTAQTTLPQALDLHQPIPAILEHVRIELDTKRAEQFGFVAKVAQQLAAHENICERSAFRLLNKLCTNKPSRKVATFLLVLQMLGYTTIQADKTNDTAEQFGTY